MLGHRQHNSGFISCETFIGLVTQTLVRFRAELKRYFWGFVWGTLFGAFLMWKPQTKAEQAYEQAELRASQIIKRAGGETSRRANELQANAARSGR